MKTCPKCGKDYPEYPATSRRDNKTEICSECGTKEAMFDFWIDTEIKKERAWLKEKRK